MAGASTGAASSAVSILLQNLSWGSCEGSQQQGAGPQDVSQTQLAPVMHWGWQWPEVTLSIHVLGLIPASLCASWAWQS